MTKRVLVLALMFGLLPALGVCQGMRIAGAAKVTGAAKIGKGGGGGTSSFLSLWDSSTTVPVTTDVSTDSSSLDLGVGWYAGQGGYLAGFRFYKGVGNTGTHAGELWTGTGLKLTSTNFTSETSSGWQQQLLSTQYPICANSRYVVSYTDPHGNYALDRPYFTSQYDNGQLHAFADAAGGMGNGVYNYPGSGFPNSSYQSSNYWVDLLYVIDTSAIGITDLSPRLGQGAVLATNTGGTQITVTGCNFDSFAAVTMGGVSVLNLTQAPTQLIFTAPPHSNGVVDIVITDGSQTITIPGAFTYAAVSASPSISSISPSAGITSGGQTVAISGTNFDPAATVTFAGVQATSVVVSSPTQLTCVIPSHAAGSVSAVVTQTSGTSSSFSFTYAAVIFSDGFDSGSFSAWTSVSSNGTSTAAVSGAQTHSSPDAAALSFALPISAGGTDRSSQIYIEKDFSGLVNFNTRAYFYFDTPAWTGSSGSVRRKLINLLDQASSTNFGCLVTTIDYQLALQCGGSNADPENSTYLGATISTGSWHSVELQMKLNTAGNHDGLVNVWLDGVLTLNKANLDTRGIFGKPEGTQQFKAFIYGHDIQTSATGSITESRYLDDVVVAGGYIGPTSPPVTITSVSPTSGPAAGGTSITISGTGFASGAAATVGGASCGSLSVVSSISITCTVPAGTAGTTVSVAVVSAGGSATLPNAFGYNSVNPSSGALLTGCTVSSGNTVNFGSSGCRGSLPAGYTLVSAVSFEDGTLGNGAAYKTNAPQAVVTSLAHTGTHSWQGYINGDDKTFSWGSPDLAGSAEAYISYWTYADSFALLNTELFAGGVDWGLPQFMALDLQNGGNCGNSPLGNVSRGQMMLVFGGSAGPTGSGQAYAYESGCTAPNVPTWGNWTQWEMHIKINSPTALGTPSDAEYQIYANGVLISQMSPFSGPCNSGGYPCSNLSGTTNLIAATHKAFTGGVNTAITSWQDAAHTICSTTLANNTYTTRPSSFSSASPCANQTPPNGFFQSTAASGWHWYFDDIIVLKR